MDDEQSDEQDFFAVTSSLADDYSATEEGIADAYREFTAGDDSPTGVYATMQHTVILNIAVVHQQECGGGCGTCDQIRLGLENAVAALRMNMDADLRKLADQAIQPAAWTRAVGRVVMPEQMYWRPDFGLGENTRPINRPDEPPDVEG
jgi:hypothetical protein